MEKELLSMFPSLVSFSEYPANPVKEAYVFQHNEKDSWFSINKKDVSKREYALLNALFTEVKPATQSHSASAKWLVYLENGGEPPVSEETDIRVIQLFFGEQRIEESKLKKASCSFFGNAMQLIPICRQQAFLIESKTSTEHDPKSFSSYLSALESDFYIKAKMYIGKFQPAGPLFPRHFVAEKEWFRKAMANGSAQRIYTMENLFPAHLIEQLPESMKEILVKEVLDPIDWDREILYTVRIFFETGFNASVTSKQLYIHRNTLQYRLNKFHEITGISLRSFNEALAVYCASMLVPDPDSTP